MWPWMNRFGTEPFTVARAPTAGPPGGSRRTPRKRCRIFQTAFPNIQLGDIEPVVDAPDPALADHYAAWIDAMEKAWGHPLAFFHADIVWERPWRDTFAKIHPMIAAKRIPLGIIYNAPRDDLSNDHWLASAQQHYEDMENNGGVIPDQAIFQSWSAMPNRLFLKMSRLLTQILCSATFASG